MLLLLLSLLALSSAQNFATVRLNFAQFPANTNNNTLAGNVKVTMCAETTTAITRTLRDVPYTLIGNDRWITLQTPGLNEGQPCIVAVTEGDLTVKKSFIMFANQTYSWTDLTTPLTIHIEWWNPWCALSPIDNLNSLVRNGARLVLSTRQADNTSPIAFREYSDKPAVCGDQQLSWSYYPRLANNNNEYFGQSCNATHGYFNAPNVVSILRTTLPVTVYAEEYRNGAITQQSQCDAQVWTLGHDGTIYPPNSAPQQTITLDTNCGDGACDSGVLISRLQVPNWCVEPNVPPGQLITLGQRVFGDDQFPATSLILNFRTGSQVIQNKPVRWYAGVPNTRLDFYVIASNSYEVAAQYPAATAPTTTVTTGYLAKAPTASCLGGSCEAQPITSTLYLDVQGHCSDIRDISIRQQAFNQQGTRSLFINYTPDCTNVTQDGGKLRFCVFNLRNTETTIEYNLHGTANTVDVPLPTLNCQNTPVSQRCDQVGGLAELCPDWGCHADLNGNGPTQINMAITRWDYVLNYQVASPAELVAQHNGCVWIPALGNLNVTVSEGCCQYPVVSGINTVGFQGCGCVQARLTTTACRPGGSCTTVGSFGRMLTVFDVAYLPEEPGHATTSVALEAHSETGTCCPFRFKTQQGGAPRCYCVLPIELSARIIETNLDTLGQACKCTKKESCVVRYADRDADCSICDFLSAFHFDLTGLPSWTTAELFVGNYTAEPSSSSMKLLRSYHRGTVGGLDNWKSVLRNGDSDQEPCCRNQTYCLRVEENAASLERCVTCSGKICEPKAFTRSLCLDLESPCPDGSITGLLDVALFTSAPIAVWEAPSRGDAPHNWVRTVRTQGGVNGCRATTKRSEPEQREAEMYDPEEMLSLTEEELLDYEQKQMERHRAADNERARHTLSSASNGRYTVLAIPYHVAVFEDVARVVQTTDCRLMTPGAHCNATDFLNCLCWNTTCTGNAIGQQGQNGGSIPSDNIWVTLGNTFPSTDGSIFRQIRGPRGYWSQNLTTCSWTRATWINATWQKAGNKYQCVPVLAAQYLGLRVEEGLTSPPAPIWPDPRGHPTVTVHVNCSYPGVIPAGQPHAGYTCRQNKLWLLRDACWCHVRPPQIFSLWEIISVRGIPSQGSNLIFKFTAGFQGLTSNQGVFRSVPATHLAVGSGQEGIGAISTWVPGYNYFCMVADRRYGFSFNWGAFAYPWTGPLAEFQPSPNAVISNFNCDTRVKPYAAQIYDWQEGLNLCRGCATANQLDAQPVVNPCLFVGDSSVVPRVCNQVALSGSYNVTENPDSITRDVSKLCRVAWVLTGSDNSADLPLGQIFKIEFFE